MATQVQDGNRFPLEGASRFSPLVAYSLTAGWAKQQIIEYEKRRLSLLLTNTCGFAIQFSLTSGDNLTSTNYGFELQPHEALLIDGAYAQAAYWVAQNANAITFCYQEALSPS